jgi:ABC-2 type transport system permease protein
VGGSNGGSQGQAAFATVLVAGVVGISIMFQGVQSVALQMAQEFGFTREIEDRVQAPCPIWLVAMSKVLAGGIQGMISAAIVLPIASVVHAQGVEAQISLHWLIILTVVPLSCLTMTSLGLVLGTSFEPRNIGLMFGFVVLPITFLGGTYYQWTRLAPVQLGSWHWLQTIVLVNPLIYVNEGMRAAFTNVSHMHLYIVYPVLMGFSALFPGHRTPQLPPTGRRAPTCRIGGHGRHLVRDRRDRAGARSQEASEVRLRRPRRRYREGPVLQGQPDGVRPARIRPPHRRPAQ